MQSHNHCNVTHIVPQIVHEGSGHYVQQINCQSLLHAEIHADLLNWYVLQAVHLDSGTVLSLEMVVAIAHVELF